MRSSAGAPERSPVEKRTAKYANGLVWLHPTAQKSEGGNILEQKWLHLNRKKNSDAKVSSRNRGMKLDPVPPRLQRNVSDLAHKKPDPIQEEVAFPRLKSLQVDGKRRKSMVALGGSSKTREIHPTNMADSAVNDAIHKAIRALSIKSADLQGDFTWTVPHPTTYSQLPDRLAAAQDWQTFKLIMCDLR